MKKTKTKKQTNKPKKSARKKPITQIEILRDYIALIGEVAEDDFRSGRAMPNPMLQLMAAIIFSQARFELGEGLDDMKRATK